MMLFCFTAKDVQLFTLLEKIRRGEQRHHTSMLSAILTKLGDGAVGDEEVPDDTSFPIRTKERMKIFEEKLQEKHLEKLIVSFLNSELFLIQVQLLFFLRPIIMIMK